MRWGTKYLASFLLLFASVLGEGKEPGVIGLIGVGKQGQRHLHEMSRVPGLRVKAVDRAIGPDLASKYADQSSIQLTAGDASVLLDDPQVDAVVIATPGNTHFDLAKQALLRGKHVLVEKPFTDTPEQARELEQLAREKNLILLVGHNRDHLPALRRMHSMVKSGELGEILSVEGNYLNPHQKYDTTHTALEGLGYHQLYMVQSVLGEEKPSKIVGALRSSDWEETVGLDLRYGQVPAVIHLSREYQGPKTRNIVVRGSNFTATFDYSHEPGPVTLEVRPTHNSTPADIKKIAFTDSENEPSLHHQLKAFLANLRHPDPPNQSNARAAIDTVETLRFVREQLETHEIYYADAVTPLNLVKELDRQIFDKHGAHGGLISIDGQSGTGKTTLINSLISYYRMRHPGKPIDVLPLDEMRMPWEFCTVYKKMALGIPLSAREEEFRQYMGWNFGPGTPPVSEATLWRNDQIEDELEKLRSFNSEGHADAVTISRKDAYIKTGANSELKDTQHTFQHDGTIIVDGKFSNLPELARYTDTHIRLTDDHPTRRARYEQLRARSLSPEATEELMRYYDAIYPHYQQYDAATRGTIDMVVDFDQNIVYQNELSKSPECRFDKLSAPKLLEAGAAAP
jgi:predicted dehydrogenase